MISAISHPTDFSPEGQMAFLHALRLAQLHRCRLDLLHVRRPDEDDTFARFPHVREVLIRWGALEPGATVEDIATKAGVTVRKVEIRDSDAVDGLSTFLLSHRPDLLVMATHGRSGLNAWLSGSVSHEVAHATHIPTLLFGPHATPFVAEADGAVALDRALVPVATNPPAGRALLELHAITDGLPLALDFVTVGEDAPHLEGSDGQALPIRSIDGEVIEAILTEAAASGAGLIIMPTAGQQGFLDALRGSTTEQVVRRASCPVLALPA